VSPPRAALQTLAGLATAGAAGLAYAGLIERNAFVLRRATVPVLPPGSASLRVLHITDLHLVPRQSRKIEWVRSLAALDPDLVINTGDNLAHLEAVPAVRRALEPLFGVPGVFVMGSNDYFAPSLNEPRSVPHEALRCCPGRQHSAADGRSDGRVHRGGLG